MTGGDKMDIKIKRGRILKCLRENYTERKLRQSDVANIIGVSVQAYQKYEYGTAEPTFDAIDKLADFYDVTADYLLGRSGEKLTTDILGQLAEDKSLSALEKKLLREYMNLPHETRQAFVQFVNGVTKTTRHHRMAAYNNKNQVPLPAFQTAKNIK